MKISKKRTVQVMVFAIALLLVLALSIGITGAWYQAKRQASGTVIMDQGIIIDYQGFGQATDGIWTKENATNFILFTEADAQPGQNIAVNASSIKANADSVDFYARVKLKYKFYNVVKSTQEGVADTKTEVELDDASNLITTSESFFGANWVKSQNNDDWFYYGADTTLGKLTPSDQDTAFVALFADNAKFIIEGANFVGADEGQGGGFKVGDKSINQIEVTLTLQTLQGSANAKNEGWSISKIIREDVSGLTSGSNTQIEDVLTSTITPTTEDVYITGAPTGPVTITIGSKAFAGCPKLVLNLSNDSNITYIIASDAFESTAKVNYGSTNIVDNIRSATQSYNADLAQMNPISGTKVYAYTPSTWTPPSNESGTASYRTYQYTDSEGNIWYYDLIDENGNTVTTLSGSALSASTLAGSTNVTAKIKYVNNTSNSSTNTTLTIPQYIQSSEAGSERYVVTVLASYNNFSTFIKNTTNAKTVVIPDSVTSIEEYAFHSCSGLTSVISIGPGAFSGCSSLESITVASGNTKYKSAGNCLIETGTGKLIKGCNTSVISDGVTSIGDAAFSGCSGLTSITIPDSVTSIRSSAFSGCSGLTSITIPDSIKIIEPNAFSGCSGLTSVTIGNQITTIPQQCFYNCSKLETVVIKGAITSIGSSAFFGCDALTTILINSTKTPTATELTKDDDTLYTEQGEVFAGEPAEGTIYYKKYTLSQN